MATDTNAPEGGFRTDDDKLRELFTALLDSLLREVTAPGAKASMLEVARAFMKDNNVALNRSASLRTGLESLKGLPFC